MTKLLRNLYWETTIDNLLEEERIKLNIKSKSLLLRNILKQRYGLCLKEDCSAISINNNFCQKHC